MGLARPGGGPATGRTGDAPSPGRAGGPATSRLGGLTTLRLATWLALLGLMVTPLALVVSLGLGANRLPELADQGLASATVHSVLSSLLSAVAAVAAGALMALLVDRSDVPGRSALRLLLLTPLLIPPFIGAIAWTGLVTSGGLVEQLWGFAPWEFYGGGGVTFLLTLHSYPVAYLIVSAALRRVPPELEEAARLAGAGPVRVLTEVTLPLVRPALVAALTLTAVANMGDFGIPVLVGLPAHYDTLATLAYRFLQSGTVTSPLQAVSQIGVVLLVLGVAGTLGSRVLARHSAGFSETGARTATTELGRARVPVAVAAWAVALLLTTAPLLALVVRALLPAPGVPLTASSLTTENFRRALSADSTLEGLGNSVLLAAGAALVCAVLGCAVALLTTRAAARDREPMLLTVLVPQAVPGMIVAVGWLILGRYTGLYNTRWVILGAYVTAFTALVVQSARGALAGMDSEFEEAARASGAGRLRAMTDTSVRLALPATAAGAVLVAVTAVRELTLSVLLVAPGTATFGVVVFQYQQSGDYNAASALSVVFMAVGLAALAVFVPRRGRTGGERAVGVG